VGFPGAGEKKTKIPPVRSYDVLLYLISIAVELITFRK
jgi:hypothetical protein